MSEFSVIVSCEHAGNQLPVRYRSVFENEEEVNSHHGWDPGAMDLAVGLAESMDVPCYTHLTTHLLVDVNCSLGHAALFSAHSNALGDEDKQILLDKYYFPYRLRVERAILLAKKPLIHLSIHTVATGGGNVDTPQHEGLCILYDPTRAFERTVSEKIQQAFQQAMPLISIQCNEISKEESGFIHYLRTRFAGEEYAGIQLQVNQKIALGADAEKLLVTIHEALLAL